MASFEEIEARYADRGLNWDEHQQMAAELRQAEKEAVARGDGTWRTWSDGHVSYSPFIGNERRQSEREAER